MSLKQGFLLVRLRNRGLFWGYILISYTKVAAKSNRTGRVQRPDSLSLYCFGGATSIAPKIPKGISVIVTVTGIRPCRVSPEQSGSP